MQYTEEFKKAVEQFSFMWFDQHMELTDNQTTILAHFLETHRNTKIREDNEGLNPPRGTSWL